MNEIARRSALAPQVLVAEKGFGVVICLRFMEQAIYRLRLHYRMGLWKG